MVHVRTCMLGVGSLHPWCQRWHHSCRQNFANMQNLQNILSVIALSVNQEINKTETLSHGVSKVTILQNCKLSKLELHPMASLDLLILQNWNIQQNWNSPHGISGFTDSAKFNKNWNFTIWHLYICCFTKTGNIQSWNFIPYIYGLISATRY